MKLTAKKVLKLLKVPGRHPDGDGLILQVTGPGNASWLFRYTRNGRERWMGLGSIKTFSLAEARLRAKGMRQQLADGIDPLEQKRAAKVQRELEAARGMTFEQATRAYHTQHSGKWRSVKHGRDFMSSIARYAFPIIGNLPVAAIDTALVLKILEQPIGAEGSFWSSRPETSDRVRGRIEAILDWAKVRGIRSGDNPSRWRGFLDQVLPARGPTKHHAALPYADVPAFLGALRARGGIDALALEFLVLTAARAGEVLGAVHSESDLNEKVWTIPAGRTKSGREHRVPLSDRALEILRSVPREAGNDHLFPGRIAGRGLGHVSFHYLLDRMGVDVTVHGFRSSFRDWAAEQTSFAHEVAEQALAHAVGDTVTRAYRRTDLFEKRRQLMQAWAKFCSRPMPAGEVVVPIRGGAA